MRTARSITARGRPSSRIVEDFHFTPDVETLRDGGEHRRPLAAISTTRCAHRRTITAH